MRWSKHSFVKLWLALKRAVCGNEAGSRNLSSETVQGAALTLQSVDDVHGCDGLALGVLGVSDGIADDVLQEYFQDATGLLVDEAGDSLDSARPLAPTNRFLCPVCTNWLVWSMVWSVSPKLIDIAVANSARRHDTFSFDLLFLLHLSYAYNYTVLLFNWCVRACVRACARIWDWHCCSQCCAMLVRHFLNRID